MAHESTVIPTEDLNLEGFIKKARQALDEMEESFEEETGVSADEPRGIDAWLEDFENSIFNTI